MDCFDIFKKRETRDQLNAGYIYIPEITTYELIYSDITSYLIANTIAKKTQCQVVRLIDQYDNNEKSKFAEKFGFCTEHTRLKGMAGAVNRLKTLFHTLYVFFTCHTGDKLLQVQIDRIPIGKYIYDSIVRTQDRNTIDRVIIWKDFKEIYNAVALFYNLKKIYQRQKPKYVILNESSYLLNLCRVLAQKHNASIIIASTIMIKIENDNMLGFLDGFYQELVSDKLKEMGGINHVEYAERYFCKYWQGQCDVPQIVNLDARKKKIECDNAAEEMRLDRKKKNVFIMAHCLSDAPHTSERLLFKDYYEALKETLCIASKIKNVNWILKIHPDFERYHGDNGVRLLREYGGDNIALFDNRWSNEVAYRLADVMITVRGTIGVEASAYGIPVVLTGESWYSKFGFTINAFSREKYTKVLNNLHRIRRLSDEKRDLAQRVLCAYLMGCNEIKIDKDDFGKDLYENMLSDKSIKAKNRSTMRILREYTAVHDLENCYISRRCLELFDELR